MEYHNIKRYKHNNPISILYKENKYISSIENDIILKNNIILPSNFLNLYNNYKITIILLLDDPDFFYNYHCMIEEKEYIRNNEILINEHCERITNFITFTNYFIDLIKKGFFSGYISFIQYKLTKQIVKNINNIWFSEYYAKKIYNKKNKIPSRRDLSYFFDII